MDIRKDEVEKKSLKTYQALEALSIASNFSGVRSGTNFESPNPL